MCSTHSTYSTRFTINKLYCRKFATMVLQHSTKFTTTIIFLQKDCFFYNVENYYTSYIFEYQLFNYYVVFVEIVEGCMYLSNLTEIPNKTVRFDVYLPINHVLMSSFCIYLKLKPYLAEWLINSLGCPVRFPEHSNENAVIRTFIQRRPVGAPVEFNQGSEYTPIYIPDSKAKPPEYYNYITRCGKLAVTEAIYDRFTQNLWNELSQLTVACEGKGVNMHVNAWCEMHGISIDHWETVRQIYFRTRKAYTKKGIDLRNFSKKK